MTTRGIVGLILGILVARPALAGTVYFGDATANIEVSGQTVIGTASTFEAVILFKSTTGAGVILEEVEPFGEDKLFEVSPTGGVYGYDYPVNYPDVLAGATTVTLDTWHHAAYVYDGAEERLYFDGVLVGSRAAAGSVSNSAGLAYIGANPIHGNTAFIGLIDSLRVSDVARYSGPSFTPPSGDLTSDANTQLLYNFDDPPGSATVSDSSPLARTGTPGSRSGGPPPVLCGSDTTDLDGDLIPDTCDPDPPTTTTSSTSTTTSTTTTLPAIEICGNCVDDDGNGRVDFEDEACCPAALATTLALTKGLIRPGAGGHAALVLGGTLSQAGLASGTLATQDVFVQLSSDGGELFCAHVPAGALTRKKSGIVFKDPSHAVATALGIDRLVLAQKHNGSGRVKAVGSHAVLASPAAGHLDVVIGLRDPGAAEATNRCAKGGAVFRAKRKGMLRFP